MSKLKKSKKKKDRATPSTEDDLRKIFIKKAAPFIEEYLDSARKDKKIKGSGIARTAVWELLSKLIEQASTPTRMNLNSKDVSEQVDEVMEKVASGELSSKRGKEYISLLQAGFDLVELPKLLASFEELQTKK